MQHDLIILSSSPVQPFLEDENQGYLHKASTILENAGTDFRLATSLCPEELHDPALEDVFITAAEAQAKENAKNIIARPEEKKKRTRRKKDDSNAMGQTKKRGADKTMTPDDRRSRKAVRKGKATGHVSAHFASGKDQENADGKLAEVAVDHAGSPPPRRRISWTPPRADQPTFASDEGLVQISEFEYKAAQEKSTGTKQSMFTIGRKIEVCNILTPCKNSY
jgi:hypothetical protein